MAKLAGTASGRPSAVRAVGAANGANPLPIVVPCHRVIGSNGSLTGFGGGLPLKQALLALERLGTRDGQRSLPHACGSGDRAVARAAARCRCVRAAYRLARDATLGIGKHCGVTRYVSWWEWRRERVSHDPTYLMIGTDSSWVVPQSLRAGPRLFVSYRAEDRPVATTLARELELT